MIDSVSELQAQLMDDILLGYRKGKILWRDTVNTWPSVRVSLELAPWQWRFRAWHDWPMTPSVAVEVGPLHLDFMANHQPFALERDRVFRPVLHS